MLRFTAQFFFLLEFGSVKNPTSEKNERVCSPGLHLQLHSGECPHRCPCQLWGGDGKATHVLCTHTPRSQTCQISHQFGGGFANSSKCSFFSSLFVTFGGGEKISGPPVGAFGSGLHRGFDAIHWTIWRMWTGDWLRFFLVSASESDGAAQFIFRHCVNLNCFFVHHLGDQLALLI